MRWTIIDEQDWLDNLKYHKVETLAIKAFEKTVKKTIRTMRVFCRYIPYDYGVCTDITGKAKYLCEILYQDNGTTASVEFIRIWKYQGILKTLLVDTSNDYYYGGGK